MQNIKAHFEAEAAQFDSIIRRLIPYYEQMLTALVDAIPLAPETRFSVLDLGCGTGAVSLAILKRFPQARITLLDLSPKMLAIARERIPQTNLSQVIESNFAEWNWPDRYDVIASSLALHHLPTEAEKAVFHDRIYAGLQTGGTFVNADVVLAGSARMQDVYLERWKQYMTRTTPIAEVETEWLPRYYAEDIPASLAFHLESLRQSGFQEVDVYWKYYNFAVFGGLKN